MPLRERSDVCSRCDNIIMIRVVYAATEAMTCLRFVYGIVLRL